MSFGSQLTAVFLFRYLGKMLLFSNDNWLAVEQNLKRAQGKWVWLAKILEREGADRRMEGGVYVVVVQAVLLFGSKTWVMTPHLEKSI